MAEPRYRERIPVLVGGGGEKKTFGIAARYADHLNIIAAFDELPRKMDAVKARCAEVGRDPATLETSMMLTVLVDENAKPEQLPENVTARTAVGSPAQIAEQVEAKVLGAGLDGAVINIPGGHVPGVITSVAEALRPLLGA
jgi:alkanesulfonate monooxygenase SsuD/methylene tetrahydromethanopterin reductase-like flavin-dependent oxidoreductase (luciferase family)